MKNIDAVNKGIDWAERQLERNLKALGEQKTRKIALSTAVTCKDYAYNDNVKKDKNGKALTHDRRNFYEGVSMVFGKYADEAYYWERQVEATKKRRKQKND